MQPTLHDKNVTSVYIRKSSLPSETLKMAYCLFSGRSITQYQGQLSEIIPGNTPDEPRTIFQVRHAFQYHYSFVPDPNQRQDNAVSIFVPTSETNKYSSQEVHCMNCAAPIFYVSSLSAYDIHQTKLELTNTITCDNEACKTKWRYMGLVFGYPRETFEKMITLVED
jgi:hypothetical protein